MFIINSECRSSYYLSRPILCCTHSFIHIHFLFYSKKIVDGTEVIEEVIPKSKGSSNPTMHIQSGISQDLNDQRGFVPSHMNTPTMGGPAHGHHDWISSLTLCQASYWYIISGSRDGVIKVWK